MKNVVIFLILTTILLTACGSAVKPTALPTVSLDKSTPSNVINNGDIVSASAVIVPVHKANLSFSAIGTVTKVNVQIGDKVTAGQELIQLDTTILEAKVKEAEAGLEAANVQVRYLKRVGTDQVHLETALADVARAQALLDSANALLKTQSTLVAPIDGTIVSVNINPSETVIPGQIVIVLGDLSNFQIETSDLTERDVIKVATGQTSSVFIEALNDTFDARVTDISRVGTTLGGDVVYKVTLNLDNQPQGLMWGMSADVKIKVLK